MLGRLDKRLILSHAQILPIDKECIMNVEMDSKERKAIEIIEAFLGFPGDNNPIIEDARRLAIKALEKQIPKKVAYDSLTERYFCPICKSSVIAMPYCFKCGQKLED